MPSPTQDEEIERILSLSSEPGYYYRADGTGAYNAWVWTA